VATNNFLVRVAVAAVVVGVIAVLVLGWMVSSYEGSPPRQRPSGVPPNAVWAGGTDGGRYFLCTVDEPRNVNPCKVWNDETGQIIANEDFWVSGEDRAANSAELKYGWYDGERIGLQIVTSEGRYLALERASGLKPITLCELLTSVTDFEDTPVAVMGRLEIANNGELLSQRGCRANSPADFSSVRVVETGGPRPPGGQLHTNEKSVRTQLAVLKAGTNLDYVRTVPVKEFRSWAVVYTRVERSARSNPPFTLVSSGRGIDFVPDK